MKTSKMLLSGAAHPGPCVPRRVGYRRRTWPRLALAMLGAVSLTATLRVVSASASASAAVVLTSAETFFPGPRDFTIRVKNNEAAIVGKTINAVRIFLAKPAGVRFLKQETGYAVGTPPAGWSVTATRLAGTDFLTYRSTSGLAPGKTLAFTFPANVEAPPGDVSGDFRVEVSSNGLETSSTHTANVNVKVLEIVAGTLKPVAPTNADNTMGVTDGSGTAGQLVTLGFTVRNHASAALSVAPTLASSSTSDLVTLPGNKSIDGKGGVASFNPKVRLGPATSDRTSSFSAGATSGDSRAQPSSRNFVVQAPVKLGFSAPSPSSVKSGFGSARTIRVGVTKQGTPGFSVSASLKFGSNGAHADSIPVALPEGDAANQLSFFFPSVSGADGAYDATLARSGTDSNLMEYPLVSSVIGKITIDTVKPIVKDLRVTLPKDRDLDQQVASKQSGDNVGVSFSIDETLESMSSVMATLVSDRSDSVDVALTCTGKECVGSATPTWDAGATYFRAHAVATDIAGNQGGSESDRYRIDTVAPVFDEATVLTETTVEAVFNDGTNGSGVAGGCDKNSWAIDHRSGLVTKVERKEGQNRVECEAGDRTLDNGVRILTIHETAKLDPNHTPVISYAGRSITQAATLYIPAKDGAGNDAPAGQVTARTLVVPAAPVILKVDRRDSETTQYETAYADEDGYHTNTVGEKALRVTVRGIRPGYTVRVERGDGEPVASYAPDLTEQLLGTKDLEVPLGPTGGSIPDGKHVLQFRLVSSQGNASAATRIVIVLDRLRPTIASSSVVGTDTVLATFSEVIVDGSDFNGNWFVRQMYGASGEGLTNPQRVDVVNKLTRRLEVVLDGTSFVGTDYWFNTGKRRYEDRAGNLMADTLQPS